MRYARIFFLHVQDVLQNRGRSFIWFLVVCINPVIYLFFWKGATVGGHVAGWNFSTIASYYFLVVIASSFLIVHIEEDVAYRDIKEGGLVRYLLQPFSYLQRKFIEEIPWRFVQGSFGIVALILVMILFKGIIHFSLTPSSLFLSVCVISLALLVSFLFKMIAGISALWITEYRGLSHVIDFVLIIFSGMILPLDQYPPLMKHIATILPFSYMIYYPVLSILGELNTPELFRIMAIQMCWVIGLYVVYQWLWRKGIYKFTGLGQ